MRSLFFRASFRRRVSRVALSLAALSACFLDASPSFAAEEPKPSVSQADAAARFAKAVTLFKSSKFADALPLFEALFEDTGSPNAALYIGHCLARLERNAEAYTAFSRALRAAEKESDPKYQPAREAAKTELTRLGVRIAQLVLSLSDPPEGLSVKVDDQSIDIASLGSALALEPGVHTITAEASDREPTKREVLIEAGETKTITLSLERKSLPREAAPAVVAPAPKAQDLRPQLKLAGYVAGGVGALGFLTLTIAGLEAKGTNASLARECARGCSDQPHLDEIEHGKTMQTLANVGLVVGAVGVAASGTLLYLGFSGNEETGTSARITPFGGELVYRGAF
jgi:tetratricopeptide (TPR) repeat protein